MSSNRLSRAAIFAGAIAGPACWRGSDPAPAQPVVTQQPPSDAADQATGIVTGIVTNLHDKQPALRHHVTLRRPDGFVQSAVTDEKGRYTFTALAPGSYTLEWYARNRSPDGHPIPLSKKPIEVEAGTTFEANLAITRMPEMPMVTPYGAPSARLRRV